MNNNSNNAYQYDYDDAYDYEYGTSPEKYTIPEEKLAEKTIILTEIRRKKEDKKIKKNIIISIVILVAMLRESSIISSVGLYMYVVTAFVKESVSSLNKQYPSGFAASKNTSFILFPSGLS